MVILIVKNSSHEVFVTIEPQFNSDDFKCDKLDLLN